MNEEFERQDQIQEEQPAAASPDPAPNEPETTEQPKKKKKTGRVIALVLVVAILSCAVGSVLTQMYLDRRPDPAKREGPAEPVFEQVEMPKLKTVVGDKSLTPAEVYANNVDSVVGVRTELTTTNIFGQISSAVCGGSGFVFSEDGYIVTNAHVVEGAKKVEVSLHDGSVYEAKIIGAYAANDVALLKIDATGLKAVTIGKSSDLVVGEQVAAIGNPLGELTYSLTVGYVSALSRALNIEGTPINVMQTDVAINSGNSGGPLFDMNGNVVGITNAKKSGQTSSGNYVEGITFSIPIDDVVEILQDLATNGRITGLPYLGVVFRDLDSSIASVYKLPVGPYVTEVVEGSCAEKAGLQVGDIVLKLDETAVESREDVILTLHKYRAGDSVTLTVYREGQQITLNAVLDERPEEEQSQQPQQQEQPQQSGESSRGFGFPFDFYFGY